MNEYEKAKAFVCDKNHSLSECSKKLGIALPTLKKYRGNPEKLKTAAWERVHALAQEFDNAR